MFDAEVQSCEDMNQSPDDWLSKVAGIRQWERGGKRAPHKPLLLLYAFGRLQAAGRNDPLAYVDVEAPLQNLLDDFGPPRKSTPAFPFRRLANDGLWVITTNDGQDVKDEPAPLRRAEATGQLDPEFAAALLRDPSLLMKCARYLLESNFPESLQRQIASVVGLDLETGDLAEIIPIEEKRRRSTKFREEVLLAYEYRCAMCGYEGRLGRDVVGLEAAHVKWWALEGPDDLSNGLALCNMHHLLFDRGVLGVSEERTVAVSRHFTGNTISTANIVTGLLGRDLGQPQAGLPVPDELHLAWHRDQVFRGPSRLVAQ